MNVVFDLDGVLIQSSAIVRRAYAVAGVVAPVDILYREGDDWLGRVVPEAAINRLDGDPNIRAEIYRVKNAEYVRLIRTLPPAMFVAAPYLTACALRALRHDVHVMTAAPTGTLDALRNALPAWPFDLCVENIRTPDKMKLMAEMTDPGVYVDDQLRFLNVPPRWRFVHYVDQNGSDLIVQILGSEEA